MTVSTRELQAAASFGFMEPTTITNADLSAGQLDNTSLSQGNTAVIAEIEIGEDTPIADAEAILLGQFLGENASVPGRSGAGDAFLESDTADKRINLNLDEGDGTDADGGQVGLGIHKEPTVAKANAYSLQDIADVDQGQQSSTSVPKFTPSRANWAFGTKGEFLTVVARAPNDGATTTFELSESTISIPVLKWDGRGDF